jgi:hypothetical protein
MASNVKQSLAATTSDVTQSDVAATDSDVAQSLAAMASNVSQSTVAATCNNEAELASFSPEMIAEDAAAREMLLEQPPLTPQVIEILLTTFHPIICLQLLTVLPFIQRWLQMMLSLEDLEEDRQAEAILKEFAKGTPVPLLPDSAANQLAMKNMMSPGCRVTRAFVAVGKKKVMVPRKKKNNHPRHALSMFNDTVSSTVLTNYFARQSTNLLGKELKNLDIIDQLKWLTLYPDPWDPTRLSLVKKASETNYWYAFLYDMFLDGKMCRWGKGSSNVLPFLVKSDILKLMRVGIYLVPLMTYKFVFACLPCLWKKKMDKDHLQVLVDAIKRNPHLVPKVHRFLYLLFSSRCENPLCMVQENKFNWETGIPLVFDRQTPFNSLHLFLASKFMLGLCPECLEKQVS